jgi:hypothetical protein
VIASFLMIFAFLASVALYDASLRWESGSSNIRRATLLAERKMEEIRAQASLVTSGTFAGGIDAILAAIPRPFYYPEAPEIAIYVDPLDNIHHRVQTSGLKPPNGVISPCSSFYTKPLNPGSRDYAPAPYGTLDPEGDFQINASYETYPYSREMPDSYRLVQVTVQYGPADDQKAVLISLIGDPIMPPVRSGALDSVVKVVRESGPANLTSLGDAAIYRIEVTASNGTKVSDVSALWSLDSAHGGTVDIFRLDAKGTRVRVTRDPDYSVSGTTAVLSPQVRYEGIQARAASGEIGL